MLTRQARRCFSSSAVLRKTLVLAEHTNAALIDSTLPAITAAAKLGDVEVLGMHLRHHLSILLIGGGG